MAPIHTQEVSSGIVPSRIGRAASGEGMWSKSEIAGRIVGGKKLRWRRAEDATALKRERGLFERHGAVASSDPGAEPVLRGSRSRGRPAHVAAACRIAEGLSLFGRL